MLRIGEPDSEQLFTLEIIQSNPFAVELVINTFGFADFVGDFGFDFIDLSEEVFKINKSKDNGGQYADNSCGNSDYS